MQKEVFIGNKKLQTGESLINGEFVNISGEMYYKITNCDKMEPFFISIASNSDHWMFISSNGALSAGRKNPDIALFPYYTVDKIQDSPEITGSKTILLVNKENGSFLWEPFSERYTGVYNLKRNIYKSIYGNKIIFEEINMDLGASFTYKWMNSEKFGFVKQSVLSNISNTAYTVSVLDGIQNILPPDINRNLQLGFSSLVDAYKKSELLSDFKIGLFMLSSVIVDKAEPSEALNTTVVWSTGPEKSKILLSSRQINNFRKGIPLEEEADVRATRGAYFINSEVNLTGGNQKTWLTIAEVNKNADYISELRHFIKDNRDIENQILADVASCTNDLVKILASADGLQLTNDKFGINRHLSNVMFNVMRGGIFDDNYNISKKDLIAFLKDTNHDVYATNSRFFDDLADIILYPELLQKVDSHGDLQLVRLVYEYLPLSFSRRHGDPSRPWNLFSIDLKKADGSKNLFYQGNWRDIFQNWEALSLSYPTFVEGMICKFLNASTADGYNPYRITRDGIDWESPDPHDPWANIGYWGDHQVIYLQKFLEISKKYHPGTLNSLLTKNIFAYANVPYRIKPYSEIVKNPFDTIVFDFEAEKIAIQRVKKTGSDGKLIWDASGKVMQVNFTEKILALVLSKLSNFIPEAGIWLNTQRPEWNDANNALVGNGVSMVTVYYLRRLQSFCLELFTQTSITEIEVSGEIAAFFQGVNKTLSELQSVLGGDISNYDRKQIIDGLGKAGSLYRETIYSKGFSGNKRTIDVQELLDFFALSLKYIDHSIRKNKRPDNLYHAYNLVTYTENGVSIRHLYEMLEGQVAVLSAGVLNADEVNQVLDALKWSAMFRRDQYSYMLYPDRQLPLFTEKNIIPVQLVNSSKVLTRLIAENNTNIVYKDADDEYHFNSSFRNAAVLKQALDILPAELAPAKEEKDLILGIFEKVFDHQSFTGRSGTFYGFEGLGCIYWHMVSKLLLAIKENYFLAINTNSSEEELGKMVQHFFDVRAGIGLNKSPEVFGAFPTDAYSHTPGNSGAKQPGMTGQVKEDIIARFGELGVVVDEGKISFNPGLLRKSEFLVTPEDFNFVTVQNQSETIALNTQNLAFTFCQVPVVYHNSPNGTIQIRKFNGESIQIKGLTIDNQTSNEIFNRSGVVRQVDVFLLPRLD